VEPVPALQQRGKKRSAAESTGDSDKTARCAVAPPSRRVVVKSPPEARRPKQRLRIGEDGQAAEPVLSEEQDTGAPEGVWVGRGEVCANTMLLYSHMLTSILHPSRTDVWSASSPMRHCVYHSGARPSRPRRAPIALVARGPVIRPRNGLGRWTSFVQTGWGSVKVCPTSSADFGHMSWRLTTS